MKNKTMLLLLVVPLLFACGNKGGNNPSSVNPGESSESSPTDTSTTSTNTVPSTSEEEPPVEPEVQTPEEMFNYIDTSDMVDLTYTAVPYEVLATSMLNTNKISSTRLSSYEHEVDADSILIPGLPLYKYHYEVVETFEYHRTGTITDEYFNGYTSLDGILYGNEEYHDKEYCWYDFDNAQSYYYFESNAISGFGRNYISYSESSTTYTEETFKESYLSQVSTYLSNCGYPNHVFDGGYTAGYCGDKFVVECINSSTSTGYYFGEPITAYEVWKMAYIFESDENLGYVLSSCCDLYYSYFLADAGGVEFDTPQYYEVEYSETVCSYDAVTDFVVPTMKTPTNKALDGNFVPLLSSYRVSESTFTSFGSNSYFARRDDVIIDNKEYAKFIYYNLYIYSDVYYVIGNTADKLNVYEDEFTLNAIGNPFRELTTTEKAYTNYPGAETFTFSGNYYYASFEVLVDFETGEIIPVAIYVA